MNANRFLLMVKAAIALAFGARVDIKIMKGWTVWRGLAGDYPAKPSALGSIHATVPSLGDLVCAAKVA